MSSKRATLADVARLAGLSPHQATVELLERRPEIGALLCMNDRLASIA